MVTEDPIEKQLTALAMCRHVGNSVKEHRENGARVGRSGTTMFVCVLVCLKTGGLTTSAGWCERFSKKQKADDGGEEENG